MTESWFHNIIRSLFASIDRAVYSLIAVVYEIIVTISKINIFGPDEINEVARKVYTLLGLIMLFKISFSFISYLVEPDQLTDKSKGVQKIIANILIVLALIIITPTAFSKLREAQDAILSDQLIPRFVFGTEKETISNSAYQMAPECSNLSYAKSDGDYISILVFRPFYQIEKARVTSEYYKDYCAIGDGFRSASVSLYLQSDIYKLAPGINSKYVIDYQFFLSTAVGIVVLLILVSFCFDIAVRSIKLGFLEIIAPIPIISYIDPKSGKDGMFKKWLREVGKTWADLFVRLFALFFAIYAIKLISIGNALEGIEEHKFWIMLLLVIGALIFAKKLPKLIESIFGVKIDGGLTLNPMKKVKDNALGGKAITGTIKGAGALAAGAAIGLGANSTALASNIRNDGLKKALMGESRGLKGGLRAAGTILGIGGGALSAGTHAAYGAYKNDSLKKGLMPGVKKSVDNRDRRDKEQDANYSFFTKTSDKLRGISGIKTEAKKRSEQIQSNTARLQAAQQNISFQQQTHMQYLDASNIDVFSTVTRKIDENGDAYYSLADKNGQPLQIDNRTKWNEEDFTRLIEDGKLGSSIDMTDQNVKKHVMEYVKLQAQRNDLDRKIFANMKAQKIYDAKDVEAKK